MMFIHNDDVKCFHMAIQRTFKLVVMGRINFEDYALIKRWWVNEKMNVTSGIFKNKKKNLTIKNNLCLLLEVVRFFEVLEFLIV